MAWHVRGVGKFHTPAVHFDGSVRIINGALATGNSFVLSWSYWFRVDGGDAAGFAGGPSFWNINPVTDEFTGNNFQGTDSLGNGGTLPLQYSFEVHSAAEDIEDPAYGGNTSGYSPIDLSYGEWHHVLASINSAGHFGSIFIDDVENEIDTTSYAFDNPTFEITAAGLPFWIGGYAIPNADQIFVADISEFWWALDQSIDLSEEGRRKFISQDGKPVGLGAHGELPTGFPPTIFGHGNKDRFLQPNLGTGGDFGLSGDLTNADSSPELGT